MGGQAEQHTFQVLTKRHERLAELAPRLNCGTRNVWMGVSIENRRFVHRADYLSEMSTPGCVSSAPSRSWAPWRG